MPYVITDNCVDVLDKSCVDECPVDCIYEGDRMLYIHPDECVNCSACEPVCPVQAIYLEEELPADLAAYTEANAEFFAKIGSPGSATNLGKTSNDPEWIKSLPSRLPSQPQEGGS